MLGAPNDTVPTRLVRWPRPALRSPAHAEAVVVPADTEASASIRSPTPALSSSPVSRVR